MKISEMVLKRQGVSYHQSVSTAMISAAQEPELLIEKTLDYILYRLTAFYWRRDLDCDLTTCYPADWWQAFRDRWMPRWWLRRHPVVWRRVTFTAFHDYPGLAIHSQEPILRIQRSETFEP